MSRTSSCLIHATQIIFDMCEASCERGQLSQIILLDLRFKDWDNEHSAAICSFIKACKVKNGKFPAVCFSPSRLGACALGERPHRLLTFDCRPMRTNEAQSVNDSNTSSCKRPPCRPTAPTPATKSPNGSPDAEVSAPF